MDDPDPMTTMDTNASPIPRMLATLAVAIALASCAKQGGEGESARHDAPATGTLPQPARPSGGVTGMPAQPGPGVVPIAGDPPPADTGGDPGLSPEENPESGLGDPDVFAAEPTPADAVELVRRYYAAIAAGDYAQAHALWSGGAPEDGQTPGQFAAEFADVMSVEAVTGEPGPVEGAAGSRFVEVPVTVTTVHRDGSMRRHTGTYVLRRAVVNGATDEQRQWRIFSAELHEARP